MWTTHIYLENADKYPGIKKGWYGYIMTCEEIPDYDRKGFAQCEGSGHYRDAAMFLAALERCKKCRIIIHTDSQYLIGGYKRIETYVKNGWRNSKGEEIKHRELWKQIHEVTKDKEIEFRYGKHEFTGWLKTEIKRRRNGKENIAGTGGQDPEPSEVRNAESKNL